MPKMHYKTPKIKKISLDEKIMSKSAHRRLEIIKIYFPTNFQAYLMNIGQIITKKTNYDNMQMSFWAKTAKTHKMVLFSQNMVIFALLTYFKPSKLSFEEK